MDRRQLPLLHRAATQQRDVRSVPVLTEGSYRTKPTAKLEQFDRLAPARGFLLGLAIGLVFWGVVAVAAVIWLR